MKEYRTISKPPIPEDDEEFLLQFFRNGQVGVEYRLPSVICPKCGGWGFNYSFPFRCPERLKTHSAIVNGMAIPLSEYKELILTVQEDTLNGQELHIFKRLEIEGHECLQLFSKLFAAAHETIINRVAKTIEVVVKAVV